MLTGFFSIIGGWRFAFPLPLPELALKQQRNWLNHDFCAFLGSPLVSSIIDLIYGR